MKCPRCYSNQIGHEMTIAVWDIELPSTPEQNAEVRVEARCSECGLVIVGMMTEEDE